jgi:hypothetical protein
MSSGDVVSKVLSQGNSDIFFLGMLVSQQAPPEQKHR